MTFDEWKRHGIERGWLATPEGHDAVNPERTGGGPTLSEHCVAHSESMYCCLDHTDVYLVRATP